ncbi:MAG: AsmA family protein [Thermodesulfobacteriota bacterium]|nr:AsmA family protein [Thermodesulfobacteriota bacterium]
MKIIFSLMLGTIILFVAALGYVLATFDEEDYRGALTGSVARFTDYQLIIDGSFKANLSLTPSVTITSVKLMSDDSTDVFAFDHLTFQLSLRPLLNGILQVNRLVADGGKIHVETKDEPDDDSHFEQEDIELFQNLVLQSVTLKNIDIVVKNGVDGELIKARLDDVTISDVTNHRPLSIKGKGTFSGTDISVKAQFGSLDVLTTQEVAYPVDLEVHSKPVNFSLSGTVDDPGRWQGLDLQVKADVASMSWLLELLKVEMPDLGRLQAEARVRGGFDTFSFEDLTLSLVRKKQLDLQVSGSVEDVMSLGGVKVKLAGSISDEALLKWLLPVDLYAITDLTFDGDLSSGSKGWLISGLTAHGKNSKGLKVDMSGRGLLDDFSADQPFGELDLLIHIDSPDTASVQGYLIDDLPELGGAVGTVRLTAPSHKDLAVEDIDVRLGREGELLVIGTGRIDKIPLDPKTRTTGIKLQLEATAVRTERMSYLFDYPLPEVGPVSLQILFLGSTLQSRVSGLQLKAGTEGEFFLKAEGGLEFGDFSLDDNLKHIDLTVDFSAVHTERLSSFFDYPLPEVGPVSLQARFVGSTLQSRVSGLQLKVGTEGEFFFKAEGGLEFGDFSLDDNLKDIDLTVDVSSSPEALALLLDRDVKGIGSLRGAGKLTRDGNSGVFDGQVTVGKTEIAAHITGAFGGERPRLQGTMTVPFLSLADFGLTPRHEEAEKSGGDKKKRAEISKKSKNPSVLFSRESFSLDFLHEMDLSLAVKLHEIEETKTVLDSLKIDLELQGGKLKCDPAFFVFQGGSVKADFLLDVSVSPPQMALVMSADDVDLTKTLAYLATTTPLEGNLNIYMDVHSSGVSPHELAANLNGDINMILENGRVPRHVLDLLAMDLLGWSVSRSIRREKYATISCGIVSLQVDSGLVQSNALLMDSPRLSLNGQGTVDLGAETIDLKLYPKKKKKFWASVTPVHIKGPLADPSVRAIPSKSAGIVAGGAILAPFIFLPAAGLNYLWETMSKDKDKDGKSPCMQKAQEVLKQGNDAPTP